jgi:ABC-type transport system involved in Fe-S cluster assembly fused permease/ATPase subunit
VLENVNVHFKPGSVVAIVGENGAGKTTLVKLLCRLYPPTRGRILVDGLELARMPPDQWRSRLSGAFQDFFKFEFRARHSIGVGHVAHLDDEPAVVGAVDRAGAADVIAHLSAGLDTQLGPTWPEGVDVSFGQWQKLALARGFMREKPLVLVLDEQQRHWTRKQSTRCSSVTRPRRTAAPAGTPRARDRATVATVAAGTTIRSPSSCLTASAPYEWLISSSSSTDPTWSNLGRMTI